MGRRLVCLAVAAVVWLPLVHLCFRPPADSLVPYERALFDDPVRRDAALGRIRGSNPEWDLMARSFYVWSLGELARPRSGVAPDARVLVAIDAIIDDTRRLEREKGYVHFLLPYGQKGHFVVEPQASQFLDGELALMLAVRARISPRESDLAELRTRVMRMTARMEKSPVLSAESYPNECWTFCNTVALAAIRLHDELTGDDHRAFFRRWEETARKKLVHLGTGLLVSSYTVDGRMLDGPEGSTIWLSAHMLRLAGLDAFADEQYALAKRALVHRSLGFAWAGEWPAGAVGTRDVDSGPVIPVVDASPSSSGFAMLAARSFGDQDLEVALGRTLALAGFPVRDGGLHYAASNPVGDAVLLYAQVVRP